MTRRKCQGPCGLNRQAMSFTGPRGRVCSVCRRKARNLASRRARLMATYGITLEEYDAMLEAQGGVCAGCGEARKYNLSVDHDHKVEKLYGVRASIRGLLCRRCNKVLRDVRDNWKTLWWLGAYLQGPPAGRILGLDSVLA